MQEQDLYYLETQIPRARADAYFLASNIAWRPLKKDNIPLEINRSLNNINERAKASAFL